MQVFKIILLLLLLNQFYCREKKHDFHKKRQGLNKNISVLN